MREGGTGTIYKSGTYAGIVTSIAKVSSLKAGAYAGIMTSIAKVSSL